jgi:hypothetical protein
MLHRAREDMPKLRRIVDIVRKTQSRTQERPATAVTTKTEIEALEPELSLWRGLVEERIARRAAQTKARHIAATSIAAERSRTGMLRSQRLRNHMACLAPK